MIFIFLIFICGLIIGSFLNCLIYRLSVEETMRGRSYCPNCKHTLSWVDLVPVFSYLSLKGKCKYCHKKISAQYPILEVITGLIFVLVFNYKFPALVNFEITNLTDLIFLLYIASSLIVIFVYDLKYYLIPDKVLFPAIIVALLYHFNYNYFLASFIATAFFLFIFLVSRGKWMGFGDVKLAILLGFILGFPNILVGLFLAFLFGAIIGLALMYLNIGKIGLKSEIPFGPFLIAGTAVALFWGNEIVYWYARLLIF